LVIGNIIGTNIANTLLILGLTAMIIPLTVHRITVYREIFFNFMAAGILIVLAADAWLLESSAFHGLDRIDGLILISYFAVFLYYAFSRTTFASHRPQPLFSKRSNKYKSTAIPNLMVKILVGSIALYIGGLWIVDGALYTADLFNIQESVIGLSIIAIGTSLPELASALTAVRKKDVDIAVGTVVGSNLFNLFWVLGLSATLHQLAFTNVQLMDAVMGLAVAFILFLSVAYGRYRHQISRFEAKIFLIIYAVYLFTLPFR
jgi:cation:H+ antiporter